MEADKGYMEDVLGITTNKHQQKIKMHLQELKQNSENFENFIVHGWGINDKGQLMSNSSPVVNNPIKIKIP